MTAKEFLNNLPSQVSKDALEGKETLFHFDLTGEVPTQMTVEIKDGELNVKEGLQGEAECVISGKGENLMKVVAGKLNPMLALMTGKIKVSNQAALLKYAKLFGVM